MTSPTPPPAPPAPSAPSPSATQHRPNVFFDWIREAGIVRTRGWLGGVAVGIANRTGIDAALIRGIFVVITLLGFPAILLYAILWLLLPDENDSIALQEIFRGRFQPQMIGILATFLFAMVPFPSLAARAWDALVQPAMMVAVETGDGGITYYSEPAYGGYATDSIVTFLLPLAAIAVALVAAILVIAIARRRRAARADAATAAMVPEPVVTVAAESNVPAWAQTTNATETDEAAVADAPVEPDEFAQWREQHAQTQKDRDAFLVAQQTDDAAAERARDEKAAQRGDFLKQMAARRAERRAANPRASLGYNLGVVGVAGVAACVVMLMRANYGLAHAISTGAFVGAAVLALGMIFAGALRRRSGFLALATVAALLVGGGATIAAKPVGLVWDGAAISTGTLSEVNQPFGWLYVYADAWRDDHEPLVITKGDGGTLIFVDAGVNLDFDATIGGDGYVIVSAETITGEMDVEEVKPYRTGNTNSFAVDIRTHRSDAPSTTQKISLDQSNGWVEIIVHREWSDLGIPSDIDPDITIKK